VADRETWLGTLMLLPAVVYILGLVAFPFFLAIALSLSDATVGDPSFDFVGLANFQRALQAPQFLIAVRNSFIVTGATLAVILVLATALSELLSQEFRGKWLLQILVILPWATPVALGTIDWLWFLDSKFSPVDWVLRAVGLLGPGTPLGPSNNLFYFGRTELGHASVVMINVWRMLPLATLIVLAGRTSIPGELLEQAQVDGAGFFRTLFGITVPLLLPILTVAVLFTTIVVFGDMTVTALTTRGGPGYATQVLPYWAFLKGIQGGALGEGAAVALFLLPVLLPGAIFALRFAYRTQVR
jgi:multiple sugar transport system permease protein